MSALTPCQLSMADRLRLQYPQSLHSRDDVAEVFEAKIRQRDRPTVEIDWHTQFIALATTILADLSDDESAVVTGQKELVLIHLRCALDAATLGLEMLHTRRDEAGPAAPALRSVAGRRPTGIAIPPPALLRQVSRASGVPSPTHSPQGPTDEEARLQALVGSTVRHRHSMLVATVVEALPHGMGDNSTPLLTVKPRNRNIVHWPLHDVDVLPEAWPASPP